MLRRIPRTTPRKTPSQQRSQSTVDCILDATARVLCEVGYVRTSTNHVASVAGVSVGSVYQYFPSKEALVTALFDRHLQQMTAMVQAKLAEVAEAPLETAVRTLVDAMFEAHAGDPRLHRVLAEEVPRMRDLEHIIAAERRIDAMVALFLDSRRRELRRSRLRAAAFVIRTAVEAVTHAAILSELPDTSLDEVAAEVSDMLLQYLETPASRRPDRAAR